MTRTPDEIEAFRAALVAANPVTVAQAASANETMADILANFAKLAPMPRAEYRAHIFETQIAARLRDFQFEERYRKLDPLSGADPRCRAQEDVLRGVKERFQNTGAIVALVGPRGTGKTSIASQLAQDRLWEDWERAISGQRGCPHRVTSYRKIAELLAKLKARYANYGSINGDQMEAYLDHICSVECLVIDEIHEAPEDSKHKDQLLTDLIDRRYSAKRDTLLISNQQKADFVKALNPSIVSRMTEHGAVIRCEWPSFRDKPAL